MALSISSITNAPVDQKLHSFGLLNGSFRPDQQIRKLRTYMRLRDSLVVEGSQGIHHMQKGFLK
jgi:transposase